MPEIEIDNLPLNTERTKEGSDNLLLKLKSKYQITRMLRAALFLKTAFSVECHHSFFHQPKNQAP